MFEESKTCAEDRYKIIIDNMIDGFAYAKIIFDAEGNPCDFMFIDINESFEKLSGYKRKDILSINMSELFPEMKDFKVNFFDMAFKVALKGEKVVLEEYSPPANRWFSYSMFSYEYGYFAVIFHDITTSKQAEEKYSSIFSTVQDAIFIADAETGQILDANPAASKMYGYNHEEILNLNRKDFVADVEKMIENIQNNLRHLLLYHKRKDGSLFPADITISDSTFNRKPVRVIASRDISDNKLVEDLKKEIEKNLLIINESKIYENLRTDFFANISHELRTPLNVILSSLQLVNLYLSKDFDSPDSCKLQKYSRIMKQNCYRLLRLVNNLIDITKLDAGFFELSLENRNIVSVVEDITLSVAEYIENKSINLVFDTEIEEKVIAIDPDKIERIVLNLLSNAIKFTKPEDSIYINLYEEENNFIISVKDTGIGIPADKLPIIFDRFRQVEQSLTRSREGSGIGLSLVKSIVELHGGKISVKSALGEGTEFIILLPVKTIPEDEVACTQNSSINHSHVERIDIEFSDIYTCV